MNMNEELDGIRKNQDELRKKYEFFKSKKDTLEQKKKILQELKQNLFLLNKEAERANNNAQKTHGFNITDLFYRISHLIDRNRENNQKINTIDKKTIIEISDKIQNIEHEVSQIKEELKEFGNIEEDYHSILGKKEKLILDSNDENTTILLKLSEEWSIIQSDFVKIHEALLAGKTVLTSFKELLASLKAVGEWGKYDTHGERLLVNSEKHHKIERAKIAVNNSQSLFKSFQNKLDQMDTDTRKQLDEEVGHFSTFAEFFYDGFVSDWFAQSKIKASLENAVMTEQKVRRTIRFLEHKLVDIDEIFKDLTNTRFKIIEDA